MKLANYLNSHLHPFLNHTYLLSKKCMIRLSRWSMPCIIYLIWCSMTKHWGTLSKIKSSKFPTSFIRCTTATHFEKSLLCTLLWYGNRQLNQLPYYITFNSIDWTFYIMNFMNRFPIPSQCNSGICSCHRTTWCICKSCKCRQ